MEKQHISLVHLLGLCPLLAITNTIANGLLLGAATIATLLISSALVSLFRKQIPDQVRLPIFVITIGATVTTIDLLLETYTHAMHGILGLFIPLIITNCVIIARIEAVASKSALLTTLYDAWSTGLQFFLILMALGTLRELIGTGSLFSGLGLLTGLSSDHWRWSLFDNVAFPLALMPSGAFFALALLIAVYKIGRLTIQNSKKSLVQ